MGSLPVCANNGYTYAHVNQVRCLKDFIANLDVLHEGGCMIHEVKRALGRNYEKKACIEPRIKFETNFVCARTNKTYTNPFEALCNKPSEYIGVDDRRHSEVGLYALKPT